MLDVGVDALTTDPRLCSCLLAMAAAVLELSREGSSRLRRRAESAIRCRQGRSAFGIGLLRKENGIFFEKLEIRF
jgi:hypothetical protein